MYLHEIGLDLHPSLGAGGGGVGGGGGAFTHLEKESKETDSRDY